MLISQRIAAAMIFASLAGCGDDKAGGIRVPGTEDDTGVAGGLGPGICGYGWICPKDNPNARSDCNRMRSIRCESEYRSYEGCAYATPCVDGRFDPSTCGAALMALSTCSAAASAASDTGTPYDDTYATPPKDTGLVDSSFVDTSMVSDSAAEDTTVTADTTPPCNTLKFSSAGAVYARVVADFGRPTGGTLVTGTYYLYDRLYPSGSVTPPPPAARETIAIDAAASTLEIAWQYESSGTLQRANAKYGTKTGAGIGVLYPSYTCGSFWLTEVQFGVTTDELQLQDYYGGLKVLSIYRLAK